jgi:nucleotidyltransferase substrate binding protein (TIGR01987 family)
MHDAGSLILGKISISDLIKLKDEIGILLGKPSLSNAEKAGLIKFFELSYELSWKTLKRVLLLHRSIDVKSGTKDIFREAAKAGYINDPDIWFDFIEDRNETVHAYNESTVNSIIEDLARFKQELEKLIANLLKL